MVIQTLQKNDILFGRGNGIAFFQGNLNFRRVVGKHRDTYMKLQKVERKAVAFEVMRELAELDPPSRFLKPKAYGYEEVAQDRVIEKICQTLREKKFRNPKAQDYKKVSKSLHNVHTLKTYTNSTKTNMSRIKNSKEIKKNGLKCLTEKVSKVCSVEVLPKQSYRNDSTITTPSRNKPLLLDASLVTPDSKNPRLIARLDQEDENNAGIRNLSLTTETIEIENIDGCIIKPRMLFSEESQNNNSRDVFGRTSSFLPTLEHNHPGENACLLTLALEEELFEPFSSNDCSSDFDIIDEFHGFVDFEVPPSLTSFFSDFSKNICSLSNPCHFDDFDFTFLKMKHSSHAISDQEHEVESVELIESGNQFSMI